MLLGIILPSFADIASGTYGEITWVLGDDGCLTISGAGEMDEMCRPCSPWEDYKSSITSAVIGNGITSIASAAFSESRLERVIIPNSVTNVGSWAFCECANLTKVTMSNSVVSIGDYAFESCTSLEDFVMPNTVTDIGERAFEFCRSLTNVTIPQSVSSIGIYAFYGCTGLTDVYCKAPSPVAITSDAFRNTSISSCTLHVPEGCVAAYAAADVWSSFSNIVEEVPQTELASGTWGDNLTWEITNDSCLIIRGTGNMANPTSSSTVPWYSYEGSITSAIVESGITNIGNRAFSGCTRIASITIANTVTAIYQSAFYGCTSLTSVTIPESVTTIGTNAFSYCTSLASVTIPKGVTRIEARAFEGCSSLTEINIPDFVETIGNFSFMGCTSLVSLTIGNSVKSIGVEAFSGCIGLTSLKIPNFVISIGQGAFYGCSGLTSLTIPNSVTTIGSSAFYGCFNLTDIYCQPKSPVVISSTVFRNFDMSSCTLHVPASSLDAYRTADAWKDFGFIVALEDESDDENATIEVTDLTTLNYAVYFPESKVRCGQQLALTVNLKNDNPVTLWQAKLELPEGFTLATDEFDDPMVSLSGSRTSSSRHALAASVDSETGIITLLCNSTSNKTFTDTDGEVATITINVAEEVKAGEYPITFREILIVEPNETGHRVDEVVSKVTIRAYMLGDLNDDEQIDGIDLVGIANFILGTPSANSIREAADVNEDGNIDGIDYVMVVNSILGVSELRKVKALTREQNARGLEISPVTLSAGETSDVYVRMSQGYNLYTLAQFDLALPEGVTLVGVQSTRGSHAAAYCQIGDGKYRVLLSSTMNQLICTEEIVCLTLRADESAAEGELTLENQLLVCPDATCARPDATTAWISVGDATDIDGLLADTQVNVYNLNGQLVKTGVKASELKQSLPQGIYVVNGKKMVVK